jgi:hypothetical protein
MEDYMRSTVIGAAVVALLGTTALVSAQAPDQRNEKASPSAREPGSAGGGRPKGSDATGKDATRGASQADKAGQASKDAAQDTKSDKAGRASKDTAQDGKSDKSGQTAKDAARSDKGDKGQAKQSDKGQASKSDDQPSRKGSAQTPSDRKDRASGSQARDDARGKDDTKGRTAQPKSEQGKAAEQKSQDRQKDMTRDRDRSGQQRDQAQGKEQGAGDRVSITETQRTELRQKLSQRREGRVTNVDFSIEIGATVPRNHRLQPLPSDIVSIVPAYRGYRYLAVEDRIIIVHPTRHVIVEVIETGDGPRRGGPVTASLELSQQEVALILDNISTDRGRADVNVDLALGAEVPSSVELQEFPSDIVEEVPKIREYRYVVSERRVVIVDPGKRDVVRVLDR